MEIQAEISLDVGHSHLTIPFKVSLDRLAIKAAVNRWRQRQYFCERDRRFDRQCFRKKWRTGW